MFLYCLDAVQFRQQETVQIEWVMEGITDKRGAVLAENNEHTPSEERYQMMIDFQRDGGVIRAPSHQRLQLYSNGYGNGLD